MSDAFQKILLSHNVESEIRHFNQLTRTAKEAAAAIGCEVGQIAKTLIFRGTMSGEPICVIASGPNRVDEKLISGALQEPIERATPEFVRTHTGFAIGGVAPLGFTFEKAIFFDLDLLGYELIWAAAGTPHTVFAISPSELLRLTGAMALRVT